MLFDNVHCLKQEEAFTNPSLSNQYFDYLIAILTVNILFIDFSWYVFLHLAFINDKYVDETTFVIYNIQKLLFRF